MQDIRNKLTVLHSADGVAFTDKSREAFDLARDELNGTDDLYVGFRKPINAVYAVVPSENENAGGFSWSYWNGSAFVAISGLHDDTVGFTRSGFVQWPRNLVGEASTVVNGQTMYWYKVTHGDASAFQLTGLNILLCDEGDLAAEFVYATLPPYMLEGGVTPALVAGRNAVLRKIKKSPWDLLHVVQARDAAVFYALSVICRAASSKAGDADELRANKFYERFLEAIDDLSLSLDANDDGIEQPEEVDNYPPA